MDRLTLNYFPWDAHRHLRDGAMLRTVAPFAAANFWGGIIMPNLVPPVVTYADVVAYRDRIRAAFDGVDFTPAMTLYLTDNTDPDDVARAYEDGVAIAIKKYPLHGTTNSDSAVTDLTKVAPVLQMMSQIGMPLCIHGEQVTLKGEPLNHLKREPYYVRGELDEILEMFPGLRISLEHISTKEAAAFIAKYGSKDLVATVTPHHLVHHIGRAMYTTDGAYMPCAKDIEDMLALRELIASGSEWIHLGTDCAPHDERNKNSVVCACGAFTGPNAHALYLEAFDAIGRLDLYEAFASLRGPRFFGLAPKKQTITFVRELWRIDDFVTVHGSNAAEDFYVRPFGYRSPTEEAAGKGVNRELKWMGA